MRIKNSKNKVQDHYKNKNGFTLIEIILIIVIVSIAIPALLILLGQGAKQGVNAEIQITASEAAQQLMEEIKSKCWDASKIVAGACTGTGTGGAIGKEGQTRTACTGTPSTYDDVDDYDGDIETCSWNNTAYTRSVEVCYVPAGNLEDISACNTVTDYKRIRVRVNNAIIGNVDVVTVVTNY